MTSPWTAFKKFCEVFYTYIFNKYLYPYFKHTVVTPLVVVILVVDPVVVLVVGTAGGSLSSEINKINSLYFTKNMCKAFHF